MSTLIHKFRLWKATLLLGKRMSILKQFESTKIQLVALQDSIQAQKAELLEVAERDKARLEELRSEYVARQVARADAHTALASEHAGAARTIEHLTAILGG